MKFGYVRVSTKEQNEERQLQALKEYDLDKIYIDKASGKDFNRPQYEELKARLRQDDILVIKELDRLGRNKQMVKQELEELKAIGVKVVILNIPTTLMLLDKKLEGQAWIFDMINNILIEVLSTIAEEERNKIRTRQAEGIALAKEQGKYKGRKPVTKEELSTNKEFVKLYKQHKEGKLNATQFTKLMGLSSRTTLYKYIKIYEGV